MSLYQGSSKGMKNRCSPGKSSLMGGALASEGKFVMSSARTRDFLILGVDNSRSYSWWMTIHQENFPLIYRRLRKHCMGLESVMTLVVLRKM